jgi:manganese efflux pump family protein
MLAAALKVAVVALSLALDVFAVSVGVGIRADVPRNIRFRIGFAFATAEVAMTCLGALLGLIVGKLLGNVTGYIGFAALIGVGCYMIYESRREAKVEPPVDMSRGWGLFIASLSISLDSLGIGFSILYIGVPMPVSLIAIAAVSVGATFLGLALGRSLGRLVEEWAELLAGIVLLLTGIAFTVLKLLNW